VLQLRSKRLRTRISFTERCNTYFSGLAGDGAKLAVWRTACECYLEDPWGQGPTDLFGCRSAAFVHDEIIVESPLEIIDAAGKRLSQVMIESMQVYCPDVPIGATPSAMRRWTKDAADAVYDTEGRLICYEDRPRKAA
jgi:hypothetical protein